MKQLLPLVLASASPRRAEILRSAGLDFEAVPADVDEEAIAAQGGADDAALRVAQEKARSVAMLRPGAAVLAADTTVHFEGALFGKPSGLEDAKDTLRLLRGRRHEVRTGVVLACGPAAWRGIRITTVAFRNFSESELAAYIATGAPLDKAGAYGIQDSPFSPAEGYDGCYLNVVGLPLCLVVSLLEKAGAVRIDAERPECPGHTG